MPKHWISLLLLIALTGLFLALWESPPALLSGGDKEKPKKEIPASYMIDSHSQHFDESGKLNYEIKASKIVHYQASPGYQQDSDYADLNAPDITLYSKEGAPWRITAKQGVSNSDGSQLTLSDDVHAWQETINGLNNELNTDQLIIHIKRNYVETDKAVIINNGSHTIKAIGLGADLNTELIRLKERVRGVHEFTQ